MKTVIRFRRPERALVGVTCLLLLTGCTPSDLPEPTLPTAATSTSAPTITFHPDQLVDTLPVKTVKTAKAKAVGELQAKPAWEIPDGFSLSAIDRLGRALALSTQEIGSSATQDVALLTPMAIGVMERGKFAKLAEGLKDPFGVTGNFDQITASDSDGSWVVWVETPSTDLDFQEWVIRATGPDGQVRELARSPSLPGGQRFPDCLGGTKPVILEDWVYWATAVPTVPSPRVGQASDWSISVQRTRLSVASGVETVADGAVMPAVLGDSVVFAQRRLDTPDAYEIRRTLSGGGDELLARGHVVGGYHLSNLTAGNGTVAWTVGRVVSGQTPGAGFLFSLNTQTGGLTRVALSSDGGVGGTLAMSRLGPVWGTGSGIGDDGEYLLRVTHGDVIRLAVSEGHGVVYANPDSAVIGWAEPGEQRPRVFVGEFR